MTQTDSPPPDLKANLARAAIVLGSALVVALLTALGIQGDLLTRVVRNNPVEFALAFVAVIAGLTVPLFNLQKAGSTPHRVFDFSGLVLVLLGAIGTIVLAVSSFGDREYPALSIEPVWSESVGGEAIVTVNASALSLRANEDMVLRVVGISPSSNDALRGYCRSSSGPWQDPTLGGSGRILSWGTSGPEVTGAATISVTVAVSATEFEYVCAYTALRDRSVESFLDDRFVWSVLDLRNPIPAPTGSPELSPSPTAESATAP